MPVENELPAPVERVKAEKGVGAQGRDYGSGPIATPAAAYWGIKQDIVFKLQVQPAMNLFKGEHGRAPNSEEEFFAKIIKDNQIKLPELPPGEKYVYDVEKAELQVERPRDP